MARLVVLSLLALSVLAGCSAVPPTPEQQQEDVGPAQLPHWQPGMMGAFTQGQHHPAVASLFAKAEQAREPSHWRSAMTYLDQARQIQPRNPAIFYRAAWVSLQMGDARQAEQLLQRGLVFAPQNSELSRRLKLLLAECLDAQGRVMEADSLRAQVAG